MALKKPVVLSSGQLEQLQVGDTLEGLWVWLGPWFNATAYVVNDVVRHNDSTWLCVQNNTNQEPNYFDLGFYWDLIAVKGGGYGPAASVTSMTIGTGPQSFMLFLFQPAYYIGARIRITVNGDITKYMEGVITNISPSTQYESSVDVEIDSAVGSGTFSAWIVNIAGDSGTPGLTPHVGEGTVDFGFTPSHNGLGSISGAWLTADSVIILQIKGGTADHPDYNEPLIEEVSVAIGDINPGVSASVLGFAPNRTTGQYTFQYTGFA